MPPPRQQMAKLRGDETGARCDGFRNEIPMLSQRHPKRMAIDMAFLWSNSRSAWDSRGKRATTERSKATLAVEDFEQCAQSATTITTPRNDHRPKADGCRFSKALRMQMRRNGTAGSSTLSTANTHARLSHTLRRSAHPPPTTLLQCHGTSRHPQAEPAGETGRRAACPCQPCTNANTPLYCRCDCASAPI